MKKTKGKRRLNNKTKNIKDFLSGWLVFTLTYVAVTLIYATTKLAIFPPEPFIVACLILPIFAMVIFITSIGYIMAYFIRGIEI